MKKVNLYIPVPSVSDMKAPFRQAKRPFTAVKVATQAKVQQRRENKLDPMEAKVAELHAQMQEIDVTDQSPENMDLAMEYNEAIQELAATAVLKGDPKNLERMRKLFQEYDAENRARMTPEQNEAVNEFVRETMGVNY